METDAFPLSRKQIKSFQESNSRLNIWCGAVRSGKTFSSILKFISLLKEKANDPGDVMIIGVSRTTVQRNVLNELYKLLGFATPSTKRMEDLLYGKNVYFVGAHDESAVRSIQGATLSLAYVDEATCIPKPFWKMLLSRLSVEGAQLLATCNPDAPNHWLKKDFLDRSDELDISSWQFELDDNPTLTETYKENLKREYVGGHWYKRYIMGQWCIAHGLVYDGFDTDNLYDQEFDAPSYHLMGVDYGTSNATAAVICAISPKRWPQIRVVDEYYYDSKKEGRSKTDAELADDLKRLVRGTKNLKAIYVDPSAASLKQELRNRNLTVIDAKNDVIEGIRICAKFINQKNILVHNKCRNTIEGLQSYAWDEKASLRGEDRPVKENDHIADSLRYSIFSRFSSGTIHNPEDDMTIEEIRKLVYGDEFEGQMIF